MKELLHLPRDWMRKVRRAMRARFFPELATRQGDLKLPALLLLDTVLRASPGRRLKVLRRLAPYLFARPAAPSADVCEINSLAEFESGYARLAGMLGHPGKTPPAEELEFLRTTVRRPRHYPGTIEGSDYFFLTAFVSILAPLRVVEIGTLTGFSAAMIAAALARQSHQSPRWVDTIDFATQCFINESRPTGFEIEEVFPELASMIRLHIPRDSSVLGELAKRDELELVFIDADHQHPMPLLDLLRVVPYVRAGGWILLHDIQLATNARKAPPNDPRYRWGAPEGPELLFESWPFRKISGGNIGAVQVPQDKTALIPFALRLMSVPYEIKGRGAESAHRALHQSFDALV